MKDYLRRTVAWILTFMMLFTCMPMNALAAIVDISSAVQPVNIIVADGEDVYVTYEFYNAGTCVDTQIVKVGGSVNAPATPSISAGKRFEGWYKSGTTEQFTAGTVSGYSENTTL